MPRPSTFSTEVFRGIEEKDFPGVNSWFLSSINPDGTGLAMFSGFHLDRVATQAYRPSFLASGEAVALFLTTAPLLGQPGRFGLRKFERGQDLPESLGGPKDLTAVASASFFYASAAGLPDGSLLVTGIPAGQSGFGGFDVFTQKAGSPSPALLFASGSTAELDAVPLLPRARPPVIPDSVPSAIAEEAPRSLEEARAGGRTFTFLVENIFANAPLNAPLPHAPAFGRRLAIEFYMSPQRTSFEKADPPILIRRADVPASGRVEVELPAGVPLFEVLRRGDDTIPVGRDGQIYHVGGMNYGHVGVTARCVGCHAGHSQIEMPADPQLMNLAPSARVTASSSRIDSGYTFRPALLTDRRSDFFRSEWAAAGFDSRPAVRFEWELPVRASEVVLHAARTGRGIFGKRDQSVRKVEVRSYLEGELREAKTFNALVSEEGTRIPLNGQLELNALEVILLSFTGSFEGGSGAALSEVEVFGRAVDGAVPSLNYLRGDADCSGGAEMADAVATMKALFLGQGPLCCQAAADANADEALDITDPIHLLNHLYRGGPQPSSPYPACGPAREGRLACDRSGCR